MYAYFCVHACMWRTIADFRHPYWLFLKKLFKKNFFFFSSVSHWTWSLSTQVCRLASELHKSSNSLPTPGAGIKDTAFVLILWI